MSGCALRFGQVLVLFLFFQLLFILPHVSGENGKNVTTVLRSFLGAQNGRINVTYTGNTMADGNLIIYRFKIKKTDVVRIHLSSRNATDELPLLAVYRETKSIVSVRLPLLLDNDRFSYNTVSRVLCPVNSLVEKEQRMEESPLSVELSSASPRPVHFSLVITVFEHFNIKLNEKKVLTVSPTKPLYVRFDFPSTSPPATVMTRVESEDSLCTVVSVQPIACPVLDRDNHVRFNGIHQTITKLGAIPVSRLLYPQFYVAFSVLPSDQSCTDTVDVTRRVQIDQTTKVTPTPIVMRNSRVKTLSVLVTKLADDNEMIYNVHIRYMIPIVASVGAIGMLYFLVILFVVTISSVETNYKRQYARSLVSRSGTTVGSGREDTPLQSTTSTDNRPLVSVTQRRPTYGTIHTVCAVCERTDRQRDAESGLTSQSFLERPLGGAANGYDETIVGGATTDRAPSRGRSRYSAIDEGQPMNDFDEIVIVGSNDTTNSTVQQNGNRDLMLRRKPKLHVSDLAMKPWREREKKYQLYTWHLITLSTFYILPAIQLVLTWQNAVRLTGDQDICYFNFLCARPLFNFHSFNNIFSNVGYVLLGLLFLILVKEKELRYRQIFGDPFDSEPLYGVPQHNGLFYAIGISTIMEGVLSSCYHMCPSYNNYQFDTAFMYMLSALGMLKIYQLRHPDVNANAHVAFIVMASLILLAMLGVFFNASIPFWAVFAIVYLCLMASVTLEFYYKGQWKLLSRRSGALTRMRKEWASVTLRNVCVPSYPDRLFFIIVGNTINLLYVIFGLVLRPRDFPSFLLAPFIFNMLLYFIYYIAMKLKNGETLKPRPFIFLILALLSWGVAIYFFIGKRFSWNRTPAQSREMNHDCILFDFYDSHDIWHFLSSLSLFLSFMILLCIDEDLEFTPRDQIAVF